MDGMTINHIVSIDHGSHGFLGCRLAVQFFNLGMTLSHFGPGLQR